jgi:hypothetical protein
VDAMIYHYPKSLEDTGTTKNRVRKAFKLPLQENEKEILPVADELTIDHFTGIRAIEKDFWNQLMGKQSVFDWDGLQFLEDVFTNNEKREHNWEFLSFARHCGKMICLRPLLFLFNLSK